MTADRPPRKTIVRALSVRTLAVLACAGTLALAASDAPAQSRQQPVDASGAPVASLAPMLKRVSPAVVNISTRGTVADRGPRNPLLEDPFFRRFFDMPEQGPRQRQFQSVGSGVVIDGKQGLIATNAHVVANATDITVTTQDGREFTAEVVGSDPPTDVAVLRAKDQKLVDVPLGNSDRTEIGDFVVAIGNPFGLQHTVTFGIVSGLGRSGLNPDGIEDFIQTDASINPGNSGGALVNLRGELIGINSAILSRSGGNIGIGFAIPANLMKSVVDQLVATGKVERGILGVNIVTLTPDTAENLGARNVRGALVSEVVQGSAADRAGVRAGDVITTVNGSPVRTSNELRSRIGQLRVGESVRLGIVRDARPMQITAQVQARDAAPGGDGGEGAQGPPHRALEGANLADAPGGGVLVRDLAPNSPAAQSGLREGDVITGVNRRPVANEREMRTVLRERTSFVLEVRRGTALLVLPVR